MLCKNNVFFACLVSRKGIFLYSESQLKSVNEKKWCELCHEFPSFSVKGHEFPDF